MDRFEKFVSTERSIRGYLSSLAALEQQYLDARMDEIAEGAYKSKPFLRSRAIDREIRTMLKKIRLIESRHNRYAKAEDYLYMVDRIIGEEPIFVRSREIMEEIAKHSELTRLGIQKAYDRMKETPYEGGYSPSNERISKKQEKEQQQENIRNWALDLIEEGKEMLKVHTEHEATVEGVLKNAPKLETDEITETEEEETVTKNE